MFYAAKLQLPDGLGNVVFKEKNGQSDYFTYLCRKDPAPAMKLKDGFTGERAIVLPKVLTDMMRPDALMSALYITDIGYYPKALHHYRERTEPLEQYVLIYCVGGKGFFRRGNTETRISAGQCFVLPAGERHTYGADDTDPWTIYWIHFGGTLAPQYAASAQWPCTVAAASTSRISDRIGLFEEIFSVLEAGFGIERLRYAMTLFHHFLGSICFIRQFREGGTHASTDTSPVGAIIHYLEENIESQLTLADVAAYMGRSAPHLSMLFKRDTGHSVMNYFNLMKIRRACDLLDSTDMKINQICFKTGIPDPYYFSRLFTKIMGLSPAAYRAREKG